jgi:phosphomethylpyrimidine synthase
VNINDDFRKYAAEQGFAEEAALKNGMDDKSHEFTKTGAEAYAKA